MSSIMAQSFRRNILPSQLATRKVLLSQIQKFAIRNSKPVLFQLSLSRSYTQVNSSDQIKFATIAKQLPAAVFSKILMFCLGLISVDLLYAGSLNKYNEYLLNQTVEIGTRPKINISDDELVYRPLAVDLLKKILQPDNKTPFYHVVCGEHGTGKTILTRIASNEVGQGVIYVEFPSDPKDKDIERFGEAFGESLNFKFEENISYMTQLRKKILGDSGKVDMRPKWRRALEAFKSAAAVYKANHNKLPVIVYDNISGLINVDPEVLDSLQDDAKMNADHRKYIAVFVSSEGSLPKRMESRSAWSRAYKPVVEIGDLSEKEAKEYLMKRCTIEKKVKGVRKKECVINDEQANELYKLVGGRIMDLSIVAGNFLSGKSLEEIKIQILTDVEKKFKTAQLCKDQQLHEVGKSVINALYNSKELRYSEFRDFFNSIAKTHEFDPDKLLENNVFAYHPANNTVTFQSRAVEYYVQENSSIFVKPKYITDKFKIF